MVKMKKYYLTNSGASACYKCKKATGTIICSLSENGIEIRVPTCNLHYALIDKDKFKLAMHIIKQELLHEKE